MIKVECTVISLDGSSKKSKFEYSTHSEIMLNNMYENTLDKIKNHQSITQVEVLAFFSRHVASKIRDSIGEDEIELELRDFLSYDNVIYPLNEVVELQFVVITDRHPKKVVHLLTQIPSLVDKHNGL